MRPSFAQSLRTLVPFVVVALFGAQAVAADFIEPEHVNFTLEGCRQATPNTIVLPDPDSSNGSPVGFVCEEGQGGDYTTGNVKYWNELDLVPFHVITTAGATATTTYNLIIAADHCDDAVGDGDPNTCEGILGYDVVTAPTANAGLSHASCSVSADAQGVGPGITGGIDTTIFRVLTITQDPDTTCVFDYTLRLAVGAAQFSGASLQAYKFQDELFQEGKATVPIFVKDILPQELDKEMSATQDTDFMWNITKGPEPATLSFGDTCDPANDLEEQVSIEVAWEILPGMPGMVTVVTNITATNPASRTVRVDVSDEIFGDLGLGSVSLDVLDCDPVDVPANTTQLVCTHIFDAPAEVSDLMDTATASYTDVATGVPVPGQTEAMASAPIQPGTQTNTTAVISDSEELTGIGLSFTLDSTSGAAVACGGALPIGPTTGPVVCTTGDQADDGFVVFNKTVLLDEPRITSGTLSDEASLLGSDGFTASASAAVSIASGATVALTIDKAIPDILRGEEELVCDFEIDGPGGFQDSVALLFEAGETSESATLTGLEPGTYVVTEGDCGGLVPEGGSQRVVDIALPSCAGQVSFTNVIPAEEFAQAQVQKITLPPGFEAGWEMTLDGPGGPEVLVTSGAGFEPFALLLQEGAYTITETGKPGWDQTMSAGCTFEVDYPADFGRVFQCTFENTQRGTIIIDKVTIPSGGTGFGFTDDIEAPNAFSLDDGGSQTFLEVVPGDYSVSEDDPTPDYDLVEVACTDSDASGTDSIGDVPTRTASIHLDPGETVSCTFTNVERGMVDVVKLTNGVEDPIMNWSFTLQGPEVNASDSTPPTLVDFDGAKLIPGEVYTICEVGIPPSWTLMWILDVDGSGTFTMPPDVVLPYVGAKTGNLLEVYDPTFGEPGAVNDTRCVDFEVEPGQTLAFIINNERPGGEPRTIGFWKNWNICTAGNQVDTAAQNGGPSAGWFLLDDLLPQLIGDLSIGTCEDGENILDKSSLDGKKRSNDAAYEVAAQLLGAKLNLSAGAETCQAAVDAVVDGDQLLTDIGFNGFGKYLPPHPMPPLTKAERAEALLIATDLDDYNNGELCP